VSVPSVRRGERTDGACGDGDLPGDERLNVELRRGLRDGHGSTSLRERNEGRRVGSVGGEERGEEGVGGGHRICVPGWQRKARRKALAAGFH